MTFWSSQTLGQKLPHLVSPFNCSSIDQASYTLKIGNEIFITKDHRNFNDPHTKTILLENQDFVIPPGQFAFLLTEESVKIPKDALAFISIKASFKHKGLVNISGFHVDPGFHGHLLFSVYNAGPTPIHLSRGLPFFLIWYASLDQADSRPRDVQGYLDIPMAVLNQISTDEIHSLQALTEEFRNIDTKVSQKFIEFESIDEKIKKTHEETEKLATRIKWWGQGLLTAITVILSAIAIVVTYFGATFISSAKFTIEQHEIITNIMRYKKVLDDLVKERADSQEIRVPPDNDKAN